MCIIRVALMFTFVEKIKVHSIYYYKIVMDRRCRGGGADYKLHKTCTWTSDRLANNA